MTDKTILVIDVDQETEERIVSTLEAEDYLVFAASGREVTSGMAGKISPALIWLKPTANSVEGFEICKTIHGSEAFKNVPIIVIASLKGPLDARYTSFYGIVDFLEPPVSRGAIIEKTEKILGSRSNDARWPATEEVLSIREENAPAEKAPVTQYSEPLKDPLDQDPLDKDPLDKDPLDKDPLDKDPLDKEFSGEEIGQPSEDYSYGGEEESATGGHLSRGGRRRTKKSGLLVPVLLVTVAIALVAGGFMGYKLLFSPAKVRVPVKAVAPKAVQAPPVLPSAAEQLAQQTAAEVKPAETKESAPQAKQALPQPPQEAPKQAPQKPLAVVPEAKPGTGPFYSVQLGAFNSEISAEALAKTYRGKGHEAFTHKGTTKDNRPIYRVLIGKFKSRKDASELAGRIQAQDKIKTTVFGEGLK